MLAIGFIRQFQEVYRDSETIVRSSRLWAATNFLLLIRFYVLFGLYVYFYLIVKEICSSCLDLIIWWTLFCLIPAMGAGWRLKSLCANKHSIRQGENRPKEPNSYSTIGISPKLQLRRSLNSKTLSTAQNGKTNSGRNLQRRMVEVTRWQK